VLVAGPGQRQPSATDLAHLFGFSPAESRVAVTLLRGPKLSEIAVETGVRMTTLRTESSSVLKSPRQSNVRVKGAPTSRSQADR
jgi:hypothetical protein